MTRLLHPVTGAVFAVLLVATLQLSFRNDAGLGFWEQAERGLLDWRFKQRGARPVVSPIALVMLDDASVERDETLFKRRAGWARLVRAVKAAGARVVVVDAVFVDKEELLGRDLGGRVRAWKEAHPEVVADDASGTLLTDIARDLEGDLDLARAVRESEPVVLATFAGGTRERDDGAIWVKGRYGQSAPGGSLRQIAGIDPVVPVIAEGARYVGFATSYQDDTATIRRQPLGFGWGDAVYYPLVVAAMAAHLDVPRGKLAWLGPQNQVRIGDRTVPLQDGELWLNYRGPKKTFDSFSAIDVIEAKVSPEVLRGKTVIIGVSRLGYDPARGPFSEMPGAEVQATALDNLLAGDWLTRSGATADLLATLGLGLLIALTFAFRGGNLASYLVVALLAIGGWVGATSWAFHEKQLWLPWLGPLAAMLSSFGAGIVLALGREARRRNELKTAFAHYLGKDALEELLADPGKLELGGEKRELTVLFSDICGFTTLSEKLAPDKLVAFLNTYLSPMTRSVLSQRGLLDKYIGDAVMAVFGAPVKVENHAATALSCALQMHADLEKLNAGPFADFAEPLRIGVGINTGDMVVGNMGSADRFDYTVAGDAVNLASRLEGLTRTYGIFCLVGEATVKSAGAGFTFRPLDQVQVKGKETAVEVFELLGGPERTIATPKSLERWNSGLLAWRKGQLAEARAAFGDFHAQNPEDLPVKLYLERLAELPQEAPAGFSPIAVFKQK
jgi:adenylate cyclase